MRYRHIRNATALLDYAGTTFLVDPYLMPKGAGPSYGRSGICSPLVDLPMPVEDIVSRADAVLLTHLHEDHFDDIARTELPRDMPILCTLPLAGELALLGFTQVVPLDPGQTWREVSFFPTLTQHGPPEVLYRMGHVTGFVLRNPSEPSLHLVGDTVLTDQVTDTLLRERPDIMVLNAGGAYSRGFEGPIIMDEVQLAATMRLLPNAWAIAVHLDATDHSRTTRESLLAHMHSAHPDAIERLLVPQDGEQIVIDRAWPNRRSA